jgi:uncharacterized OsmC-like protein
MPERIVITQKSNFETSFLSLDPEAPQTGELHPVKNVQDLTPYGMLLASLGSCTAVVVNTYAQYHRLDLNEVQLTVEYQRTFREDCEHCEEIDKYEEQISMDLHFEGNLMPKDREKLFKISLQCPIHKMLKKGIKVTARPAEGNTQDNWAG